MKTMHRAISAESNSPSRVTIALLTLAVLLPLIINLGILFRNLLPIPLADDYQALLNFSLEHISLHSHSAQLLHIISSQHNEYKFILEHLIVVAELSLTHHINFIFLQVLGDLFVVGILFVLWKGCLPAGMPLTRRLQFFLPISLLACSLNYWEALDFAMNGITTFAVHFFMLATLFLLTRSPSRLPAACVTAVCACLTSPIAFFLGPLGLLALWKQRAERPFLRSACWWTGIFLPPFGAFLYHYYWWPQHATKAFYVLPAFFFSFLGSTIFPRVGAPFFGLLLFCLLLFAFRSRLDRVNPFLCYYAILILIAAAVAAKGRAYTGILNSTAPRYQIHSNLLLIILYVFFIQYCASSFTGPLLRNRIYLTILALTTAYCIRGDVRGAIELRERNNITLFGIDRYRQNPAVNSPVYISDPDLVKALGSFLEVDRLVLVHSLQEQIYSLPPETPSNR